MIWRIRGRQAFRRLTRDGLRISVATLWCKVLIDAAADPPRVAFSIGRAVGPATTRNLIRRRLRAILRDLDLPAGWWLIGARPAAATVPFQELRRQVTAMVEQATTR